jgi:HK97 family phage prohead protease
MKELRYYETAEIRALENEDGKLILEGYAATYNTRSRILYEQERFFVEVLEPGAFKRALEDQELDVVFVRNHNSNEILARTANGTLSLQEDDRGLFFRAEINPDVSYSKDTYNLVKRGDLFSNSFAFWVDKNGQEWTRDGNTMLRKIKSIKKLHDVSVVSRAAYPNTSLTARDYEIPEIQEEQPKDEWRTLHINYLKNIKIKK